MKINNTFLGVLEAVNTNTIGSEVINPYAVINTSYLFYQASLGVCHGPGLRLEKVKHTLAGDG